MATYRALSPIGLYAEKCMELPPSALARHSFLK